VSKTNGSALSCQRHHFIKGTSTGAFFVAITATRKVRLSRSRKPQYRLNYRTFNFIILITIL